jgi:DNA-binding MarR family transcriptional regulator
MMYMHHIHLMDVTENPTPELVDEITQHCLLTRARRISRTITSIFDQELRAFEVNASQFSMLVLIARLGSASRAEIARANHQERSTSIRNLNLILSRGWAEEIEEEKLGRRRPIRLSAAGRDLLRTAMPAWRTAQRKGRSLIGPEGVEAIMTLADSLPAGPAEP